MAVVQLKFDQKGKYSYSTIGNINQAHKQLIETHDPVAANGLPSYSDNKRDPQRPHNGDHKKDLITRKNVKSRSANSGRTPNGNGTSLSCTASPGKHGKVCLCELEFGDNRKRSESIKVDNWDYIYKEKSFKAQLDLPNNECHATPK